SELSRAMPAIVAAIDAGWSITRQSLQKAPSAAFRVGTRGPPARPGPEKISVARLPLTGTDLFGREDDIDSLDDAWANQHVNIVTVVAWAGVGKSTLVNHWLRRLGYRPLSVCRACFWLVVLQAGNKWRFLLPLMNFLMPHSVGLVTRI